MKSIMWALCLSLAAGSLAFGQTTGEDYKQVEVYVGYSNGQVESGSNTGDSLNAFFRDRRSYNGFEVSGVYNFSRYFGVKGDLSGTFKNERSTTTVIGTVPLTAVTFKNDNQLWNFLAGGQVKDNSRSGVFKPFGHAMIGAAHARNNFKEIVCSPVVVCPVIVTTETRFSSTGVAGVVGGGLDLRFSDRFQIRAIQVDYNPVHVFGRTDNNVRLGAGIVF